MNNPILLKDVSALGQYAFSTRNILRDDLGMYHINHHGFVGNHSQNPDVTLHYVGGSQDCIIDLEDKTFNDVPIARTFSEFKERTANGLWLPVTSIANWSDEQDLIHMGNLINENYYLNRYGDTYKYFSTLDTALVNGIGLWATLLHHNQAKICERLLEERLVE